MRIYIALMAIFCVIFAQANAQQAKNDPREVASQSMETLRQLVTEENYKAMGFESLDELSDIALGDSLHVFFVRLDQLQEYQPGSDPNRLLIDRKRIIFPVIVKKQVRSSIVVDMVNERWQATGFGGPNLMKMFSKVRSAAADSTGLPLPSFFAVQVLALNLNFIAHRIDNELMLTPVLNDPSFEFKAGVALPAADAFERILPAAREHNGLPR